MQISNSTLGGPAATPEPTGSNELGKNEFIQLLLAQLANQDPTQPQSNEAFVAQLAQFANVEALDDANRRLEALIVAETGSYQTSLANLIGKEVVFQTDKLEVGDAGPTGPVVADLAGEAASVTVVIKDDQGKTIRTMRLGPHDAGRMDAEWDGLDDDGNPAPPGTYSIEVTAAGPNGEPVEAQTRGVGRVTGLTFANGYPELVIGNLHLGVSDVVEVQEAE